MAALVEGQQYGLSAQDKINNSKTLVFVKLTDSALRSIEEYVKSRGDSSSKPTIQFQSNNGVICLPKNTKSNQSYGFTLSNVEADGPQGSFECLRQTGHRSLESVGCMHMKMHIHANEDSYEKTRVKMAAVEQENKKFCTKEIKPAGAHLGRKVKVKRPGLTLSPIKPSSPPTAVPQKLAPKHVSSLSIGSSSIPTVRKPEPQKFAARVMPRNKHANSPELLRQTIRDRIIHILAIRPYKRPELLLRLIHDGIKEKDKKGISIILSQVAVLKDNAYSLASNLWNEVQENWKFCTPEEAEIIKTRKQQFLSANSENEIPSPSNLTNNSPLQKRAISEVPIINQDHRSKKQRISHYSRPEANSSSYSSRTETSSSDFVNTSEKTQLSNGVKRDTSVNGHWQSLQNGGQADYPCQKSPAEPPKLVVSPSLSQKNPISGGSSAFLDHLPLSSSLRSCTREDNEKNIRNHISGLSQKGPTIIERDKPDPFPSKNSRYEAEKPPQSVGPYLKSFVNSDPGKSQNQPLSHPRSVEMLYDPNMQVSPDSNTHYQESEVKSNGSVKSSNGYVNNSIKSNYSNSRSYMKRAKVTSTTNGSCSTSPHSSSDSRDSIDYNSSVLQVRPSSESSPTEFECHEYDKEYGVIESSDQRARYKADFNAQYEEYLRLHSKIKSISKKFASLEDQLHTCEQGSEDFKKIKGKIYKEYRAYQQDPNYIDALKKFNFLHHKLSHIKRLVMEYDNAQCGRS